MTSTIRAAIYARISSDDGSALGVSRQVEDCTSLLAKRGWEVGDTYIDNDVSASTGKVRPEYERLMRDVDAGQVQAIAVWDIDRLTRTPAELEQFIGLADARDVQLASVGGEVDLGTPQGRLTARIKGSVARHEVEQSSRRLKRKFLERAQAGKSHGKVAYGYTREPVLDDDGRLTGYAEELHLEQAAVIETSAKRILAGEPLRSVVATLNETGHLTPRGTPWSGTTLRQVLLRERNAGRRVHQGQVIGAGDWPAILDDDTFDRLVALLRDPRRRTNGGPQVRHLLSGIATCGRCGGVLRASAAQQSGKKRQPRAYHCPQCFKLRRKADAVDEVVESIVVARLSRSDAADLFAGDSAALQAAEQERAAIKARLDLAADQFADELITGAQLERITAKLKPKLAAAEIASEQAAPSPEFDGFAGSEAGERWESASIDQKRAVIQAIMSVKILPSGAGKRFAPDQVEIGWRAS